MKKVIITIGCFVLLFSYAPTQAALVFFDTDDPFVMPGETISVSIFSLYITDHIRMDRIGDADFGIASNLYLNPNYNPPLNEGVVINNNGVLIEGVSTGIVPVCPAVSGVLYSFDYTVPSTVAVGHIITIFADPSGGAINQIYLHDSYSWKYVTPESLTLTVVPEPGTILLFGLGMLLVRKAKQQS
jgi:hypothetical protein